MNGAAEVIYRGYHTTTGPDVIEVADAAGHTTGVLHHVVRHSPTGMTWGYGGSGPADLARSLLIAALGDSARCGDCAGTGRVVWVDEIEKPYDPDFDDLAESYLCHCDGGYRPIPYQQFKWDHVARWGDSWQISRAEILTWLSTVGSNFI